MKQLQVKLYGHWHNVEYWFEGDMNPKNIIEDVRTHEIISTPTDDKPEPPHEHKWLHNKWRTEYLSHCALDTLCNQHEFEPGLNSGFKYHVCQKCGIVTCKGDKPKTEPYKCSSYYDNNNQLQNCTCGKCEIKTNTGTGNPPTGTYLTIDKPKKIELPKDTYPSKEMRVWMESVTNWINSQNK